MSCFRQLSSIADIEEFKPRNERKIDIQPIVPIEISSTPIIDPNLWKSTIERNQIENIYHRASLNNCPFLPDGIVQLGKKWVKSYEKPSLYLFGNTGSGKTYFAYALYSALVMMKFPWVIFVKSFNLDEELLAGIEERQEKSILMKYSEVPILFIDDLGVERPSDRIIRQYYSIIDKRTGNGLTTVITSNVKIEDLPLGSRTISRLGHFYEIQFPKKDIRNDLQLPHL